MYISRATGQIVRETSVNDITVDLSKLPTGGASLRHAALRRHQEATTDVYDAGTRLTVHSTNAGAVGA